jgi:predicted amidophosphoribosyltransferase
VAFLLRDLLFTPNCLGCDQLGEWVCNGCLANLKVQTGRQIPNVDLVITAHPYEGWLREKVIAYKSGEYHLARGLAEIIIGKCLTEIDQSHLVPIPSSQEKIKIRQADTILNITKQIQLLDRKFVVMPNLKLIKRVADQVGLSHKDRIDNLEGAFGALRKISGDVILIDDVITTGSTMGSAAKTLKLVGANSVTAVALCSAEKMH